MFELYYCINKLTADNYNNFFTGPGSGSMAVYSWTLFDIYNLNMRKFRILPLLLSWRHLLANSAGCTRGKYRLSNQSTSRMSCVWSKCGFRTELCVSCRYEQTWAVSYDCWAVLVEPNWSIVVGKCWFKQENIANWLRLPFPNVDTQVFSSSCCKPFVALQDSRFRTAHFYFDALVKTVRLNVVSLRNISS